VDTITVSAGDSFPPPLKLTLTQAMPAGSILRLRASGVSMLRALGVTAVTARSPGAEPLPILQRFSWPAMQKNWMWHIQTMSLAQIDVPVTLHAGTQLDVQCASPLEGSETSAAASMVADLTWTLFAGRVGSLEDLEFLPVGAPLHLHFVAGPVDHVEAFLKSDGQLLVAGFDLAGNPSHIRGHTARVENAMAPGEDATLRVGETVSLEAASGQRFRVSDEAGRRALSNALPVSLDGTPIYLGEFHWHTDFSGDGQRTLSAALTSARDELGLDFAGPADHILPDGTYLQRLPIEQAEICRRFDAPGRFCTLPSAELSGRYGHTNLLAADWDTFLTIVKRFPHELQPIWRKMPDVYPLEVLSALCPAGKAMIIPHHTNMDSAVSEGVVRDDGRPYWCALHWPPVTPLLHQGLRLVEIVQHRGAFESESPDADWRGAWGGFGGSVRTALLRGHRAGFVGGTDNHTGWPSRATGRAGYEGLTAIQAPTLDAPALFDALYRRRCYATSGARIVADATLNGQPIGSEMVLAPGARRDFRIRIQGTAPLAAVQIVSLGAVLVDFALEPESWDFEVAWADERPGRPLQDVYYYVRLRQADGHCAWLSPWWVDPT
jgi:hypothetical protein